MRHHEDCMKRGWQGRKDTYIASSVCDPLYHWTSFVKQMFKHKGLRFSKWWLQSIKPSTGPCMTPWLACQWSWPWVPCFTRGFWYFECAGYLTSLAPGYYMPLWQKCPQRGVTALHWTPRVDSTICNQEPYHYRAKKGHSHSQAEQNR